MMSWKMNYLTIYVHNSFKTYKHWHNICHEVYVILLLNHIAFMQLFI